VTRAGLTPAALTEAAAELADQDGLAQVTLAALARRFGVSAPSLYAHVRGNADLKQRVALLALAEMADRAAAAVAGRSGRDALDALGRALVDYAAAHPGRWDAARLPLDHEAAQAGAGPRLAELTRAALRDYALEEPDLTHAVRLVGATFRGWADLEPGGGFAHSEPGADVSWQRALDGLDVALRSWDPAPRRTSGPAVGGPSRAR
jgi:AcrR family transcriptional regulator